jgi:hypothetical protein
MRPRSLSTVLFLVTIVLIAGLLTGCGGGDQSGSGSQQDGGSKAEQGENAPKKQDKNAPKKKILFGTVRFVNPKTEGFSVRPTVGEQGKKRVVFRLAKETSITLGGEDAKLEDMKKGQQAQVEYVERNERNRARSVRLFEASGGSQDDQGGEKTN